jgi:cyclophilin family peptidyl-prolyl cis-trans isomerase
MWDRIWIGRSQPGRSGDGAGTRTVRRSARQPLVESLEQRPLMASLAAISNITVPAQQGQVVALDGSGTTDDQTFTVTSSNPAITANIISGPFWTVDVSYTNAETGDTETGPLVFQLFNSAGGQTLTSNTTSMIEQFTNDGYYTSTGKYITRIFGGFPGSSNYIVQGGAPTTDGSGNSGQSGTPFNNQNFQQLAFTGTYQLAMANAGVNTNDTQFFVTTDGSPNSALGYSYTIFGQMLPNPSSTGTSDQTTLSNLTNSSIVPISTNPVTGEDSLPTTNPIFTSVTLSDSNPSGSLLIDTSQATAGETATITVTATDPSNGTTETQSFTVTVGSYAGPTAPQVNFKPFANPTTATVTAGQSSTVTLAGASGYPDTSVTPTLTYSLLSQPTNGTVSNFNAATGTFTYTPNPGFTGTDTFTYDVSQDPPSAVTTGPNGSPAVTTSNAGTVTITVAPQAPVNTGAVRVVGTVLLVTPLPSWNRHKHNTIDVVQVPSTSTSTTPVIEVYVNGQLDINQPAVDSIDNIIVFGSRANNKITIDSSVQVPATLEGGRGDGRNTLKGYGVAGDLMQSWFGHTLMVGGSGPNEMIGKAGQVKFRPTSATDLIFAGKPSRRTALLYPTPPSGTFYKYQHGRLIPVPLSDLYPHDTSIDPIATGGGKKKR